MSTSHDDHWIEHAHMRRGGLRRALNVPQGKNIPLKKEEKTLHSKNPHMRKMAQAALAMRGLRHKRRNEEPHRPGNW